MDYKNCTKCGLLKLNTSEFFGKHCAECKVCKAVYMKAYFASEKGNQSLRRAQSKYFKTDKGRAAMKKATKKFIAKKKGVNNENI